MAYTPPKSGREGRSLLRTVAVVAVLGLIPVYIVLVSAMPMTVNEQCDQQRRQPGVTDQVGFCERIGFTVMRPYYGGMVRLPVHAAGINVDTVNQLFVPVLLVAAGALWFRKPL